MKRVSRRQFIKTTASATVAAIAASASMPTARAQTESPNLVFVFADQWRRQSLGFLNAPDGGDPVITPHLDAFKAGNAQTPGATFFSRAFSCAPVCTPYRASLLTGKNPVSHGALIVEVQLPYSETGIADILAAQGYDTGYIGKWHLNGDGNYATPENGRHGFDFWYANDCYHKHMQLLYWDKAGHQNPQTSGYGSGWQPTHETDMAIKYIKNETVHTNPQNPAEGYLPRDNGKPFALFMSWSPPHNDDNAGPSEYCSVPSTPVNYVEQWVDRFVDSAKDYADLTPSDWNTWLDAHSRPNVPSGASRPSRVGVPHYFAAMQSLDDEFQRILDTLEAQGLADNTIVVFTSDHGEMMRSHSRWQKESPYEESVGIPFLVRYPNGIHAAMAGATTSALFNVQDVMPTLLGLMGLGGQIPADVDGKDFSPLLRNESFSAPSRTMIQCFTRGGTEATGGDLGKRSGWRGIRTDRYTYWVDRDRDGNMMGHMFDNANDPYQLNEQTQAPDTDPGGQSYSATMQGLWLDLKQSLLDSNDPWLDLPLRAPDTWLALEDFNTGATLAARYNWEYNYYANGQYLPMPNGVNGMWYVNEGGQRWCSIGVKGRNWCVPGYGSVRTWVAPKTGWVAIDSLQKFRSMDVPRGMITLTVEAERGGAFTELATRTLTQRTDTYDVAIGPTIVFAGDKVHFRVTTDAASGIDGVYADFRIQYIDAPPSDEPVPAAGILGLGGLGTLTGLAAIKAMAAHTE